MLRRVGERIVVLDACALIRYLNNEHGSKAVGALLQNPDVECLIHAINACEVFYHYLKHGTAIDASSAISSIEADGVVIRYDMNRAIWENAAHHKVALPGRPPIADCFCLAFAVSIRAEIVTADHDDFDQVVKQRICKVQFIS